MDNGKVEFHLNSFGRLVATLADGRTLEDVLPVRCFPFTAPDELVSLVDQSGAEVLRIARVADLPEESRKVLLGELQRRDFMPVIHRIRNISSSSEPNNWLVDTDRGQLTFTLTSEDHVRRLHPHGCIIQDSNGVRYRVDDTAKLDAQSRRYMGRYS